MASQEQCKECGSTSAPMKGRTELQHAFLVRWSTGKVQAPIIKLDLTICSDCGFVTYHPPNPKQPLARQQVRKDRNYGILPSTVLLLAGICLLYESTVHSQWYMDFYLIAGATISPIGLVTGSWAIQRHLFIGKLEQHVRGH